MKAPCCSFLFTVHVFNWRGGKGTFRVEEMDVVHRHILGQSVPGVALTLQILQARSRNIQSWSRAKAIKFCISCQKKHQPQLFQRAGWRGSTHWQHCGESLGKSHSWRQNTHSGDFPEGQDLFEIALTS